MEPHEWLAVMHNLMYGDQEQALIQLRGLSPDAVSELKSISDRAFNLCLTVQNERGTTDGLLQQG